MIGKVQAVIRRAVAGDATALTSLVMRSKAHWGYDAAFMEACREELTVHGKDLETNEAWVAETDFLVGMYVLAPGKKAHLEQLFVDPDMIGTGLGGLLWAHLEIRAVATGAKSLDLEADPFARPFYERMGMKVVGEVPSGSIAGRSLPLMEKLLA